MNKCPSRAPQRNFSHSGQFIDLRVDDKLPGWTQIASLPPKPAKPALA